MLMVYNSIINKKIMLFVRLLVYVVKKNRIIIHCNINNITNKIVKVILIVVSVINSKRKDMYVYYLL